LSAGNEYYYRLMNSSTCGGNEVSGKECDPRWWEEVREEYKLIGKATHARFDKLLPPKVKQPRKPRRRKGKDRTGQGPRATEADATRREQDDIDEGKGS
jgi:hypothetical protein